MGILDNAADIVGKGFSIWEGYKKEMDRQQESKLNLWGKKAALWKSTNQGQPMPDSMLKDLYAATGVPMPQANQGPQQGQNGQPAQQGGIPGYPSVPGQQTQLSSSNLGQQAGGQAQPPLQPQPQTQYRRPTYPQEGVAAFDVQTGKLGPITYYPEHTKVVPTNANPKGITWMVDPTGKNKPVQTFEGDPRAQQLADAGYIPMQYDVQKTKQAQEEKKESNLDAYHQAKLAQGENKPETAEQDKQRRIEIEAKKERGEPVSVADATWAKGYDRVTSRSTGEPVSFENLAPQQQKEARNRADALLRGDSKWPNAYLLARDKTGVWNAALEMAMEQDPTLSEMSYPTRQATRRSFTSGPDSKNVTSINTLIGHLASLDKSAKGLGNIWSPSLNWLGNVMQTGVGNPKVTKFNMDLGAVESELASVFKQTGATDEEIKAWRQRISSSQSPAQLDATVKEAVSLMGSRLEALRNKYEQGMGTSRDLQILSPKSRKILGDLVGKDAVDVLEPPKAEKEVQGQGGTAPGGAGTSQGISDAGKMAVGTIKTVNGVQYRKVEGGWQKIQQ